MYLMKVGGATLGEIDNANSSYQSCGLRTVRMLQSEQSGSTKLILSQYTRQSTKTSERADTLARQLLTPEVVEAYWLSARWIVTQICRFLKSAAHPSFLELTSSVG